LVVYPNPFKSEEVILRSGLDKTTYEILDYSGQLIQKGSFRGREHKFNLDISQGLYFIRYIDSKGNPAFVKMIKL